MVTYRVSSTGTSDQRWSLFQSQTQFKLNLHMTLAQHTLYDALFVNLARCYQNDRQMRKTPLRGEKSLPFKFSF